LLGGIIAFLEVLDQPRLLFPNDKEVLSRIAAGMEHARARQAPAAGHGSGQGPQDPNSRLPDALQSLPLDIPALTTALGDGFVSPPLLTSSSRTIREFSQFFPTDDQQMVFRLACQKLAHEFGGYSTTRTSVLFTVKPDDDPREQVIVAIYPSWSELDERGVPFEASPKLIAKRSGSTLAHVEKSLGNFPEFIFRSAGCRLICGPLSVDVLTQIVASRKANK
jgi:hypothetical protein